MNFTPQNVTAQNSSAQNSSAHIIKEIFQKDNHTFTIVWGDGVSADYRLSDLQELCPCAGCVDEVTGKRLTGPSTVKKDVKALKVSSVGRYALRVHFTSGCCNGIYGFDMLRHLAQNQLKEKA